MWIVRVMMVVLCGGRYYQQFWAFRALPSEETCKVTRKWHKQVREGNSITKKGLYEPPFVPDDGPISKPLLSLRMFFLPDLPDSHCPPFEKKKKIYKLPVKLSLWTTTSHPLSYSLFCFLHRLIIKIKTSSCLTRKENKIKGSIV